MKTSFSFLKELQKGWQICISSLLKFFIVLPSPFPLTLLHQQSPTVSLHDISIVPPLTPFGVRPHTLLV
jgi:hypothetical protein